MEKRKFYFLLDICDFIIQKKQEKQGTDAQNQENKTKKPKLTELITISEQKSHCLESLNSNTPNVRSRPP